MNINEIPFIYIKKAKDKISKYDYEKAILLYSLAINICPYQNEIYWLRGVAKTKLNKHKEALEDFKKYKELDEKTNIFEILKSDVSEKKKELENKRILKIFQSCFEKLNYKEKFIFKYRLIPGKYKTLKEIGILLNLSTQRIWQIENVALKKFRSAAKKLTLEDSLYQILKSKDLEEK